MIKSTPPEEPIRDLLLALQATGASFGETLGFVRSLRGGRNLARRAWHSFLANGPPVADVLLALVDAAGANPCLAEDLLQAWFQGGPVKGSVDLSDLPWVRSLPSRTVVRGHLGLYGCGHLETLPPGLQVGRDLELDGCVRLRTLPEGLTVGGDLWAESCSSLRTLPARMQVGGSLFLAGSPWDGVVPVGVKVGGRIFRGTAPD